MRPSVVLMAVFVGAMAVTAKPASRAKKETDLRPLLLRPGVVSLFARSQKQILLDLLWLRVLNAVGEDESERKNLALYEYGVFFNQVDPQFYSPYYFLGLNVPYRRGRDWVNAEQGDDLLRRGLEQFPADERLLAVRGAALFTKQKKYVEAAEMFERAARLPSAPPYYRLLALRLRAQAGAADDAVQIAQAMLNEVPEGSLKDDLQKRVDELKIEALLQRIDAAAKMFADQYGRKAWALSELAAYSVPTQDHLGGQLTLDASGRATSTSLMRRLELYGADND